MAGKTRVTVAEGWTVYVHVEQHSGGDTVDVDVDADTAQHWVNRGWAVEASETTTKARPRSKRPTAPSR